MKIVAERSLVDRATPVRGTRPTGLCLPQHDGDSMVTAKIQNGIALALPGIGNCGNCLRTCHLTWRFEWIWWFGGWFVL